MTKNPPLCPFFDECQTNITHVNNLARHLRSKHNCPTRPRGGQKKVSQQGIQPAWQQQGSPPILHDLRVPLPPPPRAASTNITLSLEKWSEPRYPDISDISYYWNTNGLLKKLLQLPPLDHNEAQSEHEPARFITPSELPQKSEGDALRQFADRQYCPSTGLRVCPTNTCSDHLEAKFYYKGQGDSPNDNEAYRGEYYNSLLFNLSAPARSTNVRYAKISLEDRHFNFALSHLDEHFLLNLQQPELFASPAGSWSDVHLGIVIDPQGSSD